MVVLLLGTAAATDSTSSRAQEAPTDGSARPLLSFKQQATAATEQNASSVIELPEGFLLAEVARGLVGPTDMAFLPNGDLLVAEKGVGTDVDGVADVRLVRDGVLREAPVLSIGTNVYADSGLLALAIDPNFADNGWFYLWHATGETSPAWSGESAMRLSRFTFNQATGTAVGGSEVIIYEGVPWSVYHNGGALGFASDGSLILATGDAETPDRARYLGSLSGKLLRFFPTDVGHDIPADNPWLELPEAHPSIYAIGLRNPFRMTRRQADGALFFGDVGQITFEEINRVQGDVDYAWPEREGPCPSQQRPPCTPAPAHVTEPVLSYPHPEAEGEGAAVTALAFYEGTQFPEEYHGNLFFADIDRQFIARAVPNTGPDGSSSFTMQPFATNSGFLVDMEYFDEGLYVLDIFQGKIFWIYYSETDNQPPVARLSASIATGSAPLAVTFSAAGSSDIDDRFLTYRWELGDGSTRITSEPTLRYTYTSDGLYTVRLTVVDARGGESLPAELSVSVYSGALPEIMLEHVDDPSRTRYHGGDAWRYSVSRQGVALLDGLDSAMPFTWRVEMQHNEHAHPIISSNVTSRDTFAITADNHGGDWNLWYRFSVTMRTETGQEITVQRDLRPEHVQMEMALETTFRAGTGIFEQEVIAPLEATNSGAQITVNAAAQPAPHAMRAIVGSEHFVEAPATLLHDGNVLRFEGWYAEEAPEEATSSAPPAITRRPLATTLAIFPTVPANDVRYVASYVTERAAEQTFLPLTLHAASDIPEEAAAEDIAAEGTAAEATETEAEPASDPTSDPAGARP